MGAKTIWTTLSLNLTKPNAKSTKLFLITGALSYRFDDCVHFIAKH